MRQLADFARVIVFDKRGSGLSDPVAETATIEQRMDDVRAVMDAAGSERADVFGWSEGAAVAAVFGASHPARVSALVLYGAFACGTPAEGYPRAIAEEATALFLQEDDEEIWGQGFSLMVMSPTGFEDEALVRWWSRFERQSMSPRMARAAMRLDAALDIRGVLPSVRVPTLVIHRTRGCASDRRRALDRRGDPGCPLRRAGWGRPLAGSQTRTRSSTWSRSSSPASAPSASRTACSPRCCSPT